ncbi:hypothetical protein PT974_06034 [Cladobotryum mycophilum]|uniref:Rhodanese domain-containing protein n=1 Tax=Cladobotryum mycophilum TaxID=491253 RepID=A0ABR0SKE2_9HYPO
MATGGAPTEIPQPQAACSFIEASEVMQLLEDVSATARHKTRDFLLVDVRRTDWEGGTITTSINFPAQSFYQTRSTVYQLCKQAGIKRVIFYCGSCNGRGPRCAGWLQDYLNEVGETDIQAIILKGGIKGWQKTYGSKMMDYYDETVWSEQNK